jgi:Protein of unknown function (DUF2848)
VTQRLNLLVTEASAERSIELAIADLVIAGWTGRDAEAVEKHIAELEAIGVKRPPAAPCFYRVSAALLTTGPGIQASGPDSSGEVEFVLYGSEHGMLVGVGSDHTDRKVETHDVTVSKQMCFKPVSASVWRMDDVAAHWDHLMLRSWAWVDGQRRLYQEGPVSNMRPPADLVSRWTGNRETLPHGAAMFCGTLAVQGGIAAADRFEMELADPVLDRVIRHEYTITALPVDA